MRHVASLSRDLQASRQTPALVHSLYELKSSALSLAVDDHHIYCGSQNHDIAVWNKASFTLKHTLQGHTGSVLALELAEDKNWLFSASGDSTIRVRPVLLGLPLMGAYCCRRSGRRRLCCPYTS